jgi:DNA-binding NarL/FixJ family response regulator
MATMVIVDDDRAMRLLGRLTAEEAGCRVLGEAETGEQGVELALRHKPLLVLMDFRLPDIDGAEATRRILAARAETIVVGWTSAEDEDTRRAMLEAGAREVVHKSELERLRAVLAERAAQG